MVHKVVRLLSQSIVPFDRNQREREALTRSLERGMRPYNLSIHVCTTRTSRTEESNEVVKSDCDPEEPRMAFAYSSVPVSPRLLIWILMPPGYRSTAREDHTGW